MTHRIRRLSLFLLILSWMLPFAVAQSSPETGLAKPGSTIAVLDLFNLTENPEYDSWERLLGRGLRRGLHTYKTQHSIQIEVVPYPRIFKALKDLGMDTYYIAPEQAKAIGERLQSDLVVLGSFNVVEGVIACSLKIVDNHSGNLLHEETRFGTEEKITGFVKDLSETLNKLLLAGIEPEKTAPQPAPVVSSPLPPAVDVKPSAEEMPAHEEKMETDDPSLEPVEVMEGNEKPAETPPITQIAGPGGAMPPVHTEEGSMPPAPVAEPTPAPAAVLPPPVQSTPSVEQVLNQSWQKTQGTEEVPPQSQQQAVQQYPPQPQQAIVPQAGPSQLVGPPSGYNTMPPQGQGQAAPPMMPAPSGLPPRAPVTPSEPIESLIPPLPPQQQAPPKAVQSPFEPMPIPTVPPPSPEQLGYPMTPPVPNAYPPGGPQPGYSQTQPQKGPVRRFFSWLGRGVGIGNEPATQPVMPNTYPPNSMQQPPAQAIPQQQAPQPEKKKPFLWIFGRGDDNQ